MPATLAIVVAYVAIVRLWPCARAGGPTRRDLAIAAAACGAAFSTHYYCVFLAVPLYGIAHQGLRGYLRNYIRPTVFMLPFNLIGELSRTLALAVRLFGNVMSTTKIVAILLAITPLFFPILMHALGLLTGLGIRLANRTGGRLPALFAGLVVGIVAYLALRWGAGTARRQIVATEVAEPGEPAHSDRLPRKGHPSGLQSADGLRRSGQHHSGRGRGSRVEGLSALFCSLSGAPPLTPLREPRIARFASYGAGHFMGFLRRLLCAVRGHEDYLHFEKNRVCLQCVACGHESPGWTVESRRPVLRFPSRRGKTSSRDVIRRIA